MGVIILRRCPWRAAVDAARAKAGEREEFEAWLAEVRETGTLAGSLNSFCQFVSHPPPLIASGTLTC